MVAASIIYGCSLHYIWLQVAQLAAGVTITTVAQSDGRAKPLTAPHHQGGARGRAPAVVARRLATGAGLDIAGGIADVLLKDHVAAAGGVHVPLEQVEVAALGVGACEAALAEVTTGTFQAADPRAEREEEQVVRQSTVATAARRLLVERHEAR